MIEAKGTAVAKKPQMNSRSPIDMSPALIIELDEAEVAVERLCRALESGDGADWAGLVRDVCRTVRQAYKALIDMLILRDLKPEEADLASVSPVFARALAAAAAGMARMEREPGESDIELARRYVESIGEKCHAVENPSTIDQFWLAPS